MQTAVESEVTDLAPFPVVTTVAVNRPPKTPFDGRLEMAGVVGVSRPTSKVCGLPSLAA